MRRGLPVVLLVATLSGCAGSSSAPAPSPAGSPSASSSPSPSASPSPRPSPSPSAARPPSPNGRTGAHARLIGDGIDLPSRVLVFGTTFETAAPALRQALGRPTLDTGIRSSVSDYGSCPGTKLRALEYAGGALVVLFGDVKGSALTMYAWALQPKGNARQVPKASALVGDVTTFEFGIGTTLGQLKAGIGTDMLKVRASAGSQAPSFTVTDQSSGFSGQLSGTSDRDDVTYLLAGRACGE